MRHITGSPENRRKLYIVLCLGVLLIAAFAVISHADELAAWSDESWTIFHSSTSIQQILAERDITWPFGSFAALHYWGAFASWNDFSLHVFGALCGLLTTALLIQIGKQFHSRAAGLLAGLAFGTSSYALYFVLEIRGYTLMLLMKPLLSPFICAGSPDRTEVVTSPCSPARSPCCIFISSSDSSLHWLACTSSWLHPNGWCVGC
jgi:hypothetical protein